MTPKIRKLTLTAHVVSTVGWMGAIAAFLALAITGLTSHDIRFVDSAYIATLREITLSGFRLIAAAKLYRRINHVGPAGIQGIAAQSCYARDGDLTAGS